MYNEEDVDENIVQDMYGASSKKLIDLETEIRRLKSERFSQMSRDLSIEDRDKIFDVDADELLPIPISHTTPSILDAGIKRRTLGTNSTITGHTHFIPLHGKQHTLCDNQDEDNLFNDSMGFHTPVSTFDEDKQDGFEERDDKK